MIYPSILCLKTKIRIYFSAKAKNELSANLHHRMKWVVFIQNQISEVGQLLVMHVEELRRLRRKLDVVEQIHVSFQLRITKNPKVIVQVIL